jgi:hypothetical protein
MENKMTIIKIDVTDWAVEHDEVEPDVSSEDKLVELSTKFSTPKLARLAIIAREKGSMPENILPANKPLFQSGAWLAISSLIKRRVKEVELPNGSTVEMREFVGVVGDEDDHLRDDTLLSSVASSLTTDFYVHAESDEGLERAIDYLLKRIPGYVYGRLVTIAANGGDVRKAADELKVKIDEIVERLD